MTARTAEKPEEIAVFHKEKKEPKKRKENRPDGKVENAMKLRFPLSHRACHQRPEETTREGPGTKKGGGLSTAVIQ